MRDETSAIRAQPVACGQFARGQGHGAGLTRRPGSGHTGRIVGALRKTHAEETRMLQDLSPATRAEARLATALTEALA
ncbi:protein of unknown function [Methylorubrum extorquens]|uniref:Uncharacterized protein n=1 Tax=Methylorubrum extorquens TaxID=408 RepID=A0A2N9AXA4_METEX|nr:protein of unknown function [Methylorubrum extorquens]